MTVIIITIIIIIRNGNKKVMNKKIVFAPLVKSIANDYGFVCYISVKLLFSMYHIQLNFHLDFNFFWHSVDGK